MSSPTRPMGHRYPQCGNGVADTHFDGGAFTRSAGQFVFGWGHHVGVEVVGLEPVGEFFGVARISSTVRAWSSHLHRRNLGRAVIV